MHWRGVINAFLLAGAFVIPVYICASAEDPEPCVPQSLFDETVQQLEHRHEEAVQELRKKMSDQIGVLRQMIVGNRAQPRDAQPRRRRRRAQRGRPVPGPWRSGQILAISVLKWTNFSDICLKMDAF